MLNNEISHLKQFKK